jgi:hypothetical protein
MLEIKTENSQSSKFDMRAPPRRRAKGGEMEEQPVFLRKAFAMISTCPTEIGQFVIESLIIYFLLRYLHMRYPFQAAGRIRETQL